MIEDGMAPIYSAALRSNIPDMLLSRVARGVCEHDGVSTLS